MTTTYPSKIGTLPKSLQHIARRLEAERALSPAQMTRLIKEAKVQPGDLLPWADFRHPVEDSYGRKMVYKGDHFEIMVMSWLPGDFSAIHDHGHTQWGAVQIFGPAEHATFRIENNRLTTLARWRVSPGDVIGVGHTLVHQMGNPTSDTQFLSLHVYGDMVSQKSVTGDARLFDLQNNTIQRVDGGVFFALPDSEICSIEAGPVGDFPTRLRYMVELIRRLRKMQNGADSARIQRLIAEVFSEKQQHELEKCLQLPSNRSNALFAKSLLQEVKEAAALQATLQHEMYSPGYFDYQKLFEKLSAEKMAASILSKEFSPT